MDQLYTNTNLNKSEVNDNNGLLSTASLNQLNGIPQESKLATYISNRKNGPSQNVGLPSYQNDVLNTSHSTSALLLNPLSSSPSTALQSANITKSLAALGLDGLSSLKSTSLSECDTLERLNRGISSTSSSHLFSNINVTNTSPLQQSKSALIQPSPIRSNQSHKKTADVPYHENVRGTTYFYPAQGGMPPFDPSDAAQQASQVFLPYHVSPTLPANIHHLKKSSGTPHFFMGDELRNEIINKQSLCSMHPDPELLTDLPTEVDVYYQLMPLEPPNTLHKSSMFGYATSVYKVTHTKTGIHYCLYRIHGYRLSNTKVTHVVDMWKALQHSSVVQLRQVFTTKDFGDNSIAFVFDFFPAAQTLASRHFSPMGMTPSNWERLVVCLNTSGIKSENSVNGFNSRNGTIGMLPESVLWTYIIQLTGALRAIHSLGLACRTLDASKIILVDHKTRIRINACGILDVLNFDPNASNPLAGVQTHQQEDLVNLGKLIVSLACGSNLAVQRDNISTSIDLISRHYSRDLATLVICLLTSQRVKSINDVMPIIGARFYVALEASTQRADVYELELSKEVHNGRLFRLLAKINTIIDRTTLNQDNSWSETGDRYMLKLFRDFTFHQQTTEGSPWLDYGHIITALNKLDAGSQDKICLMSGNEQNILVTSYAELKKCFERSFDEIVAAVNQHKHSDS